jgi:hypothetical protein
MWKTMLEQEIMLEQTTSMSSYDYQPWMFGALLLRFGQWLGALLLRPAQWLLLQFAVRGWLDCLVPTLQLIAYVVTLFVKHFPPEPSEYHRNHTRWRVKMAKKARQQSLKLRYLGYKDLFHRSFPLKSRIARLYPFPSDLIRQVDARRKKREARRAGMEHFFKSAYGTQAEPPDEPSHSDSEPPWFTLLGILSNTTMVAILNTD